MRERIRSEEAGGNGDLIRLGPFVEFNEVRTKAFSSGKGGPCPLRGGANQYRSRTLSNALGQAFTERYSCFQNTNITSIIFAVPFR